MAPKQILPQLFEGMRLNVHSLHLIQAHIISHVVNRIGSYLGVLQHIFPILVIITNKTAYDIYKCTVVVLN